MNLVPSFEYRRLGDFTYHILIDPEAIKSHLMKWILREWELDHNEAPHEHWTVEWMQLLPRMELSLEILPLQEIRPHPDLMSLAAFRSSLEERADDRECSMLRGVSIEPLLVNRTGWQLMAATRATRSYRGTTSRTCMPTWAGSWGYPPPHSLCFRGDRFFTIRVFVPLTLNPDSFNSGTLFRMSKRNILILAGAGFLVLALAVSQIPAVNSRLAWRYEVAKTYARNVLNPVGSVPTAIPVTPRPTNTASPTLAVTATPEAVETAVPATPTLAPPPPQAGLASPPYEKQTPNNCGPAALSMLLKYYGWTGDQKTISDVIKPVNGDRNVNPEEMAYWIRNFAGWLRVEYRVGGDLDTIKRLIAAGYPVLIEGTTSLNPDDTGWPDDDLWAAHYLLLNGYDDAAGTFTAQDPYRGPDKKIPYEQVESEWKPFNYVYMVVYLPEQEEQVKSILGESWDPGLNRLRALDMAEAAIAADPSDSFAWFNKGSNLIYFERYDEANAAYDKARALGLPQRMFRYQFGPFIANFQANRTDDLLTLTEYALQRTEMSEETWLWHGWALYRQGDTNGAVENWRKALSIRPGYEDALYALSFVGATP